MKELTPKIESPKDWAKAKNFIPKLNQIIIYDGVKENGKYKELPRLKIGDGIHTVTELPFAPNMSIRHEVSAGVLVVDYEE